jgi:hypothetical protein
MTEPWHYQVRVYLSDALAALAITDPTDPALAPLTQILQRHHATMKSQYQAFAEYLAEAERDGPERFPLYRWTKATLDDPAKRAKHAKAFALRIDDQEVYSAALADALATDLQPLVAAGHIERLSKQDTNPANNIPVPAEYRA